MHRTTLALATALTLSFAGTALADDHADRETIHKRVMIETADGESTGDARVIFIDRDGNASAPGHTYAWSTSDGPHAGAFDFHFGGSHGYLGVQMTELTPELRVHLGAPEEAGILVSKVLEDSPAERAGIQVGDIISRAGDADVETTFDLRHAVMGLEDGDPILLEVWRDGSVSQIDALVELREMPAWGFKTRVVGCEEGEACEEHHAVIDVDCDGDDCHHMQWIHEACEEGETCQMEIECNDGECTCVSNGNEVDCPQHMQHH